MKLIFLDIDWVLNRASFNPEQSYRDAIETKANLYWAYRMDIFDTECVKNLKMILDDTSAYIVISSAWRTDMDQCKKSFSYDNLDWMRVIWKTPGPFDPRYPTREHEIIAFLNSPRTPRIENYIVLDDEHHMPTIENEWRFIKTIWSIGLTAELAIKAIKKLNS